MKRILFILLALLPVILPSCGDDVMGDWDPMEWKSENNKKVSARTFDVSAAGQTVTYYCKNYDGFWLSSVTLDGTVEGRISDEDFDAKNVSSVWGSAVVDGNKLTVTIKPNTTGAAREVSLSVTAGDIFDNFTFEQAAE
jgi:hypothetical protein